MQLPQKGIQITFVAEEKEYGLRQGSEPGFILEDWEFYKAPFGSERRVAYIVYPKNADSYEERTFALQDVTGKQKVSFAFLPGSNFDFSYFRFEK